MVQKSLLFLPLSFFIVYFLIPRFRSDATVFTPKNLLLFIWLNKLVFIPLEVLIVGNKATLFDTNNQPITTEVLIVLVSFIGFIFGFIAKKQPIITKQTLNHSQNSYLLLLLFYLAIGLCAIVLFHGSLQNYFLESWLTPKTRINIERMSGTTIGFLANVGQRFLPFGIILLWIYSNHYFKKSFTVSILCFWLCILCTLSSNRSNTLFPIIAFLSVMMAEWKTENKILIVATLTASIFGIFFFSYIRFQEQLDLQNLQILFNNYISNIDYIWSSHQIYFGTPYQITPLLHSSSIAHNSTLIASFLDPIPLIGKAFREQSGSFVYNLLIYDSPDVQDKTIPVAGELFYNSGYALVFFTHIFIGWVFAQFDRLFKKTILNDPIIACSVFYLSLLFCATLLLSISVLVQFIVFNAAPALIILLVFGMKYRLRASVVIEKHH